MLPLPVWIMSALTFFGMSLSAAAQVADLRPLEAEAAKALEAYGFMKEAEHSMSVGFRPFGPKEWWEQLEQDPWAMALFAEKELEVAVWKEPPYVSWHIAGRYALNFMSRPQQTDQWSNTWSTRIRIANRKVTEVTYKNAWKDGPYEMRSARFNYFLMPFWEKLKRVGPFDGLVVLRREPSTGEWTPQSAKIPDRGSAEFESQVRAISTSYIPSFREAVRKVISEGRASQTNSLQSRFQRLSEMVVHDKLNNLYWAGPFRDARILPQSAGSGERAATEICKRIDFAGRRSWEVPSVKQLDTILDVKHGRLIDTDDFAIWGRQVQEAFRYSGSDIIVSDFSRLPNQSLSWNSAERRYEWTNMPGAFRGLAFCVHDPIAAGNAAGSQGTSPTAAASLPDQSRSAGNNQRIVRAVAQVTPKEGNLDVKGGGTAIVGSYAIQHWFNGRIWQVALLKFDQQRDRWTIVKWTAGFDELWLQDLGVPAGQAKELMRRDRS